MAGMNKAFRRLTMNSSIGGSDLWRKDGERETVQIDDTEKERLLKLEKLIEERRRIRIENEKKLAKKLRDELNKAKVEFDKLNECRVRFGMPELKIDSDNEFCLNGYHKLTFENLQIIKDDLKRIEKEICK